MQDILDAIGRVWGHVVYTAGESNPITIGQIILILVLVVLGFLLGRYLTRLLSKQLAQSHLQKDAAHAIERIVFYTIIIAVFMTALSLLHVPLAAFAFISGAIAIGIGFGAQNIINNFISGWILMSERPVRIGDVIEIGNNFGVVEAIGGRSTRIRRSDGVHLLVPNSRMLEDTVVNWTLVDRNIRTMITVGVAYGSPVRQVQELLARAVNEQPEVLQAPPPQIIFEDFGDSSLVFQLLFWSDVGSEKELREIRSEIRFRITDLFAGHGITIPFPQHDVHLIEPHRSVGSDE